MADNKDKKVLNVPALRFPEFSGEWRYSSLWNECDILCGYPFDGQDILEDSGSVKLLRGINITEGEIRHSKELDRYYSGDISRLEKYILKEGDLVLGMDGSKVGRNSAILTISEHGSYLVQRVCRIRSQKHNVEYIFHNINNSKFHRYVDSVKTASAIPHISQSDIQDYIIAFPPTTEEQIKITSLFSLLDQRIATQNKIIEKLETLIKGIVETVISSQKPNTLIKNCLECNSSTLQESQVAETGTFPVYGATDISGYTETAGINGESILIIKDGSGVGTVKFVSGEYSYIGTLNSLTAKDGYCLKYIYFALQRFSFEPYKTGMAIPHIYFKDYGKAKIYCPSFSLQTLIAQKLSLIENKMEVEKRIILCYQLQRSYLLSRMFI